MKGNPSKAIPTTTTSSFCSQLEVKLGHHNFTSPKGILSLQYIDEKVPQRHTSLVGVWSRTQIIKLVVTSLSAKRIPTTNKNRTQKQLFSKKSQINVKPKWLGVCDSYLGQCNCTSTSQRDDSENVRGNVRHISLFRTISASAAGNEKLSPSSPPMSKSQKLFGLWNDGKLLK